MIGPNAKDKKPTASEKPSQSACKTRVLVPVQLTVLVPVDVEQDLSSAAFNGTINGYDTLDPNQYPETLEAAVQASMGDPTMQEVMAEMLFAVYRIRNAKGKAVEAYLTSFAGLKEEERV
ncbi:MAG: hypothetical protein GY854_19885 [Deltaproteobacteria bacterium]|nr:hypothetical protein [Deltaproteobacteria bacterium]